MDAHDCNTSLLEADARSEIQGQSILHREFQDNEGNIAA